MEKNHLHLLIHEEIYRIDGDEALPSTSEVSSEDVATEQVSNVTTKVSEPKSDPLVKSNEEVKEMVELEVKEVAKENTTETSHQDSPEIPIRQKEEEKETIPFAVFHSSSNTEEMELLQKIIDACKIPEAEYIIYSKGFDQSVLFKKALVFVPEAKAFYSPIPYKGSQFLCSKPLSDLAKDQQEKGKLWVALQAFLK